MLNLFEVGVNKNTQIVSYRNIKISWYFSGSKRLLSFLNLKHKLLAKSWYLQFFHNNILTEFYKKLFLVLVAQTHISVSFKFLKIYQSDPNKGKVSIVF